ncbi:MAG: hypothetical protein GC208_00815 [Alphaproteobacteria bacterium]|nr:hypothetical protein [Alphaproteobacteria bacterium]
MKTQALLSSLSTAAAAAAAFIAVAGAPAHASDFGGDRCSITFQGEPNGGMLSATVAPGYSGTYSLLVRSATPGNAVLANLSGGFSGRGSYPTMVVSTLLSTTYVNDANSPINGRPDAPRRQLSELRDGVYGDDARLLVDFEVRDSSGRLVCRQSDYRYENVPLPFGGRLAARRAQQGTPARSPWY